MTVDEHAVGLRDLRHAAFYDGHADAEWVSSTLLRIEVARAVVRAIPALLPELDGLVTYDDRLLRAATDAGLVTVSPGCQPA